MYRRRLLRLGGTAIAAPALAGCSAGGNGGEDGEARVSMTDEFAFDPAELTVDAGTTVTWVNDGSVAHTVTAYEDETPAGADYFASGGFDSERAARTDMSAGFVRSGETFEHTFEVEGRYRYFCIPHESSGMKGTVAVRG